MMGSVALKSDPHDPWLRRNVRARRIALLENFQNRRVALPGYSPNDSSNNTADLLHRCPQAPSVADKHATEGDPMSLGQKHRNLAAPRKPNLQEVKERLNDAITRHIPKHRVTAKEIAAEIDVSETTADNLRRDVPDAMARAVMLGRAFPAFGLEMMAAMGIDIDADPKAFAIFLELQRTMRGG